MKYTDIMLDLETLGTGSNAAILSIGAFKFNLNEVEEASLVMHPDRVFYRIVDLKSCEEAGLTISADTIKWWMQQSDAAREIFNSFGRVSLVTALADFYDFAEGHLDEHGQPTGNYNIWGNGAVFDNVILGNAYAKWCGTKKPWSYRQDRCYRTLSNLLPQDRQPKFKRLGTYHNAMHDAMSQAFYAQKLNHILQGRRVETNAATLEPVYLS